VFTDADRSLMLAALGAAVGIQRAVSPNPGVGAAIQTTDGRVFIGATQPPGGPHAEVMAIRAAQAAGASLAGAALASTLEPCNHTGRTGPCTEAIIEAGIPRVLIGVLDPDRRVSGAGVRRLHEAGVEVLADVSADQCAQQLEAYLHHRRTGRPFVTLKLAASLDGRTAAPDRTSQWITSIEARTDSHRLRAEHDAILVGAGTVRADDPTLTVRLADGPDPLRIVLGTAPADAKVRPCREMNGPLPRVLDELGASGVLSLMVEGGAAVAHAFHAAGLINRYVVYLAPMLFGGDDALALFAGPGADSLSNAWRGRVSSVQLVGPDVRIELRP
jgi:diaminohydroxyphosphoribosylaminopyrimidine deaminase / 5-amino-6-(5-phosphoribosylamino)uracil reductase